MVEVQVRLEATPEVVFPYLTESDRFARWQGIRAELDPRPSGVFRVWMDAVTIASGEYLEVEPHRRVVFTWGWEGNDTVPPGSTTVEIDLEADGAATILTLRHSGLPTGSRPLYTRKAGSSSPRDSPRRSSAATPGPCPSRRRGALGVDLGA